MVTLNLVNIGSGNGLLPDCAKPLLYLDQCWLITDEVQWQSPEVNLTRDFHWNLPGANEWSIVLLFEFYIPVFTSTSWSRISCFNDMSTWSVWPKTKFGSQNFGFQLWWPFVYRLPKLVANISYQYHHLVNTVLTVGSLVKWLPIKVAHTCKLDTIWVVYCSVTRNGSIRLQSHLTHYALWNFTSNGGALQWTHWH